MNTRIKSIGLVFMAAGVAVLLWKRFSYPDMTQIRWFLEFWPVWIVAFVMLLIGIWIYQKGSS